MDTKEISKIKDSLEAIRMDIDSKTSSRPPYTDDDITLYVMRSLIVRALCLSYSLKGGEE